MTDLNERWEDVFRMISWWDSEKTRQAVVMVIGAGALGNEVLKNLALLNIGQILIVDFDTIEYSNLSRSVLYRPEDAHLGLYKSEVAASRLREINPNIRIMTINGDITTDVGLGVFRRVDVVIGCLDNRLARLVTNRNCFKFGKTWIDGAIENLSGQLTVYTPGTSCYECQLDESEWDQIRSKIGCPDIARRNQSMGRIPTTPISASIIGALQAQEALKVLYQNKEQSLAGQKFMFEGMNNFFLLYKGIPYNDECESHIQLSNYVLEAAELNNQSTISEVQAWGQKTLKTESITIQLDHEIVTEVSTTQGEKHSIMKAKPHLSDRFLASVYDGSLSDLHITGSFNQIGLDFDKRDLRLDQLGIPPLHILHLETEDNIYFVELTGDKNYLNFIP